MNRAPVAMILTGVPLDAKGEIEQQHGRPATINLRGMTTMRVQAYRKDAAAWNTTSAPVIAIEYRLGDRMPWVEGDTVQRVSAAGIFPATGTGYDVTGYAEARLNIIAAGPAGSQGDVALYAEDTQ